MVQLIATAGRSRRPPQPRAGPPELARRRRRHFRCLKGSGRPRRLRSSCRAADPLAVSRGPAGAGGGPGHALASWSHGRWASVHLPGRWSFFTVSFCFVLGDVHYRRTVKREGLARKQSRRARLAGWVWKCRRDVGGAGCAGSRRSRGKGPGPARCCPVSGHPRVMLA